MPFLSSFVRKSTPSPSSNSGSTSIPSSSSLPSPELLSSPPAPRASGTGMNAGPLPLRSFLASDFAAFAARSAAASVAEGYAPPFLALDPPPEALWRFEWADCLAEVGRFLSGILWRVRRSGCMDVWLREVRGEKGAWSARWAI